MRLAKACRAICPSALPVVVLLLLAILAGCARPAPEAALRLAVARLQSAIESRDAGALRDMLADDFIGNDGLDRDAARRLAALYFLRSNDVVMTLGPQQVTIDGDRGRVDTTVAITGGSGRLLPDRGAVYAVRSGWRLQGREWRLSSVEWTSF